MSYRATTIIAVPIGIYNNVFIKKKKIKNVFKKDFDVFIKQNWQYV